MSVKRVIVQEQKPSGEHGGQAERHVWYTRQLNHVAGPIIPGIWVVNHQIILNAGNYWIEGSAPAWQVGRHRIRLYNVTDQYTETYGTSEIAEDENSSRSFISAVIAIGEQAKAFEIQHWCSCRFAKYWGQASSMNDDDDDDDKDVPEIYTTLQITKL